MPTWKIAKIKFARLKNDGHGPRAFVVMVIGGVSLYPLFLQLVMIKEQRCKI